MNKASECIISRGGRTVRGRTRGKWRMNKVSECIISRGGEVGGVGGGGADGGNKRGGRMESS